MFLGILYISNIEMLPADPAKEKRGLFREVGGELSREGGGLLKKAAYSKCVLFNGRLI